VAIQVTGIKPFVLALSGPPGAGKTTLTQVLRKRRPEARVLYYDKYQPVTKLSPPEVRAWFARGGDPNELDHSEIVADLRRETRPQVAQQAKPLLVFETPFGRLHRDTGAFIDFLVWVETPLDIALSRAILAFTRVARAESSPQSARQFIDWQLQYMTNYPLAREMYLAQRARIQPFAELTLDNSSSPEAAIEVLDKALADLSGLPTSRV
jgi:uridine kinase